MALAIGDQLVPTALGDDRPFAFFLGSDHRWNFGQIAGQPLAVRAIHQHACDCADRIVGATGATGVHAHELVGAAHVA